MNGDTITAEAALKEKEYIVISTAGQSMMPMLRDRKDTVEIRALSANPKKYDVVLFKKGERLVLHRIIKVVPEGYIIRGDNCIEKDTVKPDDIIGVLFSYTRNGKRRTVNDAAYKIYSRATVLFHPIKAISKRIKGIIKRIFRCR